MPNEQVVVTISGVNPQTKTVTVPVDASSGTGTITVSWTGTNFGLDNISATATITGAGLTSNTAQHRWGYNDLAANVASPNGSSSSTHWKFVVIGVFPDGTHTGPSKPVTITATHFYLQWTGVPGVSYYNVYCTESVQGDAGGVTATVGLLHGVGSGNGGNNSSTVGGGGPNFPSSITQLWMDDGSYFPYRGNGSAPPATNTSLLAPSLATPSGRLTLTPAGSATVVGSVCTLNVNVSGIVYTSVPYIGLYEGVSGSLPLYNSPSLNTFTYQTYNGQPVDKAVAVNNAWSLSGNNTYWQGRTSVTYDGTNFNLTYNGSAPAANNDTTTLTIAADDIAWYNATPKTFDLFAVQGTTGGVTDSVLINWLVRPSVASVSPTTALANGTAQTFTVTLTSPISPRQLGTQYATGNSIAYSFSMVGGTVTNAVALYNGSGWLTGWNVTATIPVSTSNSTATLSANVTGTLTYLNGTSFTVGGAVTYIAGAIATINVTGSSFNPPQEYSFTVSPAGPSYSGAVNITLTGIVFQRQNNPVTLEFISSTGNIIPGTQTSRVTGSFGGNSGWITTFQNIIVSSSYISASPGVNLGFRATDSTSGLSVTFLSSGSYYEISSGGGGGGGGCPAVEMFLDSTHRVCDVVPGFAVNALVGEPEEYVCGFQGTESAEVVFMNYDTQPCYCLTAENGAEVVVSGSTPVPTLESVKELARGAAIDQVAAFANEVRSGMHVITDVGRGPEWSKLIEVTSIGMRRVCRVYCGGKNFAAGAVPGKYIYTHNLQYVK